MMKPGSNWKNPRKGPSPKKANADKTHTSSDWSVFWGSRTLLPWEELEYFGKPSGARAERSWRGKGPAGAAGSRPCDCTAHEDLPWPLLPLPPCSLAFPPRHHCLFPEAQQNLSPEHSSLTATNFASISTGQGVTPDTKSDASVSFLLCNMTRQAQVDPRVNLGSHSITLPCERSPPCTRRES